jgi:hypothetical protein
MLNYHTVTYIMQRAGLFTGLQNFLLVVICLQQQVKVVNLLLNILSD